MQRANTAVQGVTISAFLIDKMSFCINVQDVIETIYYSDNIIKVSSDYDIIDGVVNLRGNIIPLINMRKLFGLKGKYSDTFCIAITNFNDNAIGLMFDNIDRVLNFPNIYSASLETNTDKIISLTQDNELHQFLNLKVLLEDYNFENYKNNQLFETQKLLKQQKDLAFYLGKQEYCVDIFDVQEIININNIQSKVNFSEFVKGVINLRGTLIPIVDLTKYLNNKDSEITNDSKLLILSGEMPIGLIVNNISEVITYETDKILPISGFSSNEFKAFKNVIAISKDRNILKIDTQNLFTEDAKRQIKAGIYLNTEYVNKKQEYSIEAENSSAFKEAIIKNKEFIIFKLNDLFAFEIKDFQEIIQYDENITALPQKENYIEGILNLRSEAILVSNLRKYYGLEDLDNKKDSKIIILNIEEHKIGLIVDDVIDIIKSHQKEITRTPSIIAQNKVQFYSRNIKDILCVKDLVKNQYSTLVILLDPSGFLNFADNQKEMVLA